MKKYVKRESEHFIVYYDELDGECIDGVLNILEEDYSKITRRFKEEIHEKLVVEICHEHKELLKSLGASEEAKWVRGGINKGKILIASPLDPPFGADYKSVIKTAVHEFTHIIIGKVNDYIPKWLDEGIASYEAKDNNENWIRKTIIEGINNNTIPTFKELDTGDDFERFFKSDGYQYSYTIVEFLVCKFGYERLIEFVKSPKNYFKVFEMTELKLQIEWKEYIKRQYLI